jgi:hypothetical protein
VLGLFAAHPATLAIAAHSPSIDAVGGASTQQKGGQTLPFDFFEAKMPVLCGTLQMVFVVMDSTGGVGAEGPIRRQYRAYWGQNHSRKGWSRATVG